MKNEIKLGIMSILLCGCTMSQSALNYSNGSDCLARGDYKDAIPYFEECVKLGPNMSLNQNNLACAYEAEDHIDKAWGHSRIAVRSPPYNEEAFVTFKQIYFQMLKKNSLAKEGIAMKVVKEKLGEPDETSTMHSGDRLVYGVAALDFKDQKLVSYERFISPPYMRGGLYEH